jgi:hypothetical protein
MASGDSARATDSARKVARAAKAGGGPTRSQRNVSWGYYGSLIAVAVVGTVAVVASTVTRETDNTPPYVGGSDRAGELATKVREAVRKHGAESKQAQAAVTEQQNYQRDSHWHMAYAVYDCSQKKGQEFLPPVNGESDPDPRGIHAHADGLIHIHPFVQSAAGKKAVMNEFFKATGFSADREQIKIPAKDASSTGVPATKARTIKEGTKCADGKTGEIRAVRFDSPTDTTGKEIAERYSDIRLLADEIVVFALAPKDFKIPVPPSARNLAAPSDLVDATANAEGATSSTVAATGSSTSVAAGASTTVAPSTTAGSATTSAPATTAAATTTAAP